MDNWKVFAKKRSDRIEVLSHHLPGWTICIQLLLSSLAGSYFTSKLIAAVYGYHSLTTGYDLLPTQNSSVSELTQPVRVKVKVRVTF
jgi:hypothetical protein